MNQRRTIMGSLDYSLSYLQEIKRELMNLGDKKQEMAWAIGGLIVTLSSHLLRICKEVVEQIPDSESNSAREDVLKIQTKFNEIIEQMLVNSNE